NVRISMTETGDPKDNAQAERINNTMKNELLKGRVFHSLHEVIVAVSGATDFYNNRRPHMSINMMTPVQAASLSGELEKKWYSYRENTIKENLDIPNSSLPLHNCPGHPSGLRPTVNPGQG
ncbi:MAG: integrase core domain-containing protein, partial [Muribaculaceae bacterium]|nr:integrase core domain-containing protein [Muribaculaceae bacterium]